MPTFAYTARDSKGNPASGTLVAGSVSEVTQLLHAEGKFPVAIREAEPGGATGAGPSASASAASPGAGRRGIRVSRADVIQVATQLAVMVETGVTIVDALDCVAAQAERPNLKALVTDLSQHVQGGGDFSSALARHPRSFSRLFVCLIKASEKSGMLVKMLNRATAYLRDEQETLRRVKGALTYPGIMLAFAVSTTSFLLAFVLPRFGEIYADRKAALPVPTQMLLSLSGFVTGHCVALPVGLAAAAVLGYVYFRRTPSGARLWHYVQLNLPLVGPMFRKMHLARGLRAVGTMAGAGVSLTDCVKTAEELTDNTYFQELWAQVGDQIQSGRQLSEPLFHSPLVPRAVAQMLHSGEKGGRLAAVMEQVSGYAEAELKEKIAELTRYIEPAMIVMMGAIIGGVAMALLLPILRVSKVMGG